MKYKRQIISGICVSLLVWGIFIIADFIDEIILNRGIFIGAVNIIITPFIMLICYSINYIKHKTTAKSSII